METTANTTTSGSGTSNTGNVTGNIDKASNNMHDSIDRASDAARPAVDRIASSAHQAVDSIADAAYNAADTLGEKSGNLKEMQARFMEDCNNYVRENPMASLGIAAAAGFLLSRMISSR
ncbi:MAG TPA: hypothetical protein VFX01_02055 [Methylophilaceae bacterium]|nr:hypothetical protein [Methylophilaceae bacterium]